MKIVSIFALVLICLSCTSSREDLQLQSSQRPDASESSALSPSSEPTLTSMQNVCCWSVIAVGNLSDKAKLLPHPDYPLPGRTVRASGKVMVQVLVDKTGNVISATALSGHPLLRSVAEKAAREARFEPTFISGQTTTAAGVLIYTFKP